MGYLNYCNQIREAMVNVDGTKVRQPCEELPVMVVQKELVGP